MTRHFVAYCSLIRREIRVQQNRSPPPAARRPAGGESHNTLKRRAVTTGERNGHLAPSRNADHAKAQWPAPHRPVVVVIACPPPLTSLTLLDWRAAEGICAEADDWDIMESSSFSYAMPRTSLTGRCAVVSLLLASSACVSGFTTSVFQEKAQLQRTAPSKTEGVEIELPNFEEMFSRIQAISPLAKLAIQGGGTGEGGGFGKIDDVGEF